MNNADIVDSSSCEFNIRNGNEIEIDSIDINTGDIVDEVMRNVSDTIDEYVEALEEATEEA